MGSYYVKGGREISGELNVQGSKNACLPILAASVLSGSMSVIHNCPDISDTHISLEILRALGCVAEFSDGTVIVDSSRASKTHVPRKLAEEMRSSILFAGSLLSRFGELTIYYPGGCAIDKRPIDYHVKSFVELGATVDCDGAELTIRADKLTGKRIVLDFPSVGATENTMVAAVLAHGVTEIVNAAREPEIADLQNYLNGMGARIEGAGGDTVRIEGVKRLKSGEHSVIEDRIVAGTYLAAAAITGGEITLCNMDPAQLYTVLEKFRQAGCDIQEGRKSIRLRAPKRLNSVDKIITMPHSGFPTDMQAQMMALLATADGISHFSEKIFSSRDLHVDELRKMGAIIASRGMDFEVTGAPVLYGSEVEAKDLRGGAALIIASLAAQGETEINGSGFVERGYERIEDVLSGLGADIRLVNKAVKSA